MNVLLGYMLYDLIHYYLHYGNPNAGHLYGMKRSHFRHHFKDVKKGFGVTTSVWDRIWKTKFVLRKMTKL